MACWRLGQSTEGKTTTCNKLVCNLHIDSDKTSSEQNLPKRLDPAMELGHNPGASPSPGPEAHGPGCLGRDRDLVWIFGPRANPHQFPIPTLPGPSGVRGPIKICCVCFWSVSYTAGPLAPQRWLPAWRLRTEIAQLFPTRPLVLESRGGTREAKTICEFAPPSPSEGSRLPMTRHTPTSKRRDELRTERSTRAPGAQKVSGIQ